MRNYILYTLSIWWKLSRMPSQDATHKQESYNKDSLGGPGGAQPTANTQSSWKHFNHSRCAVDKGVQMLFCSTQTSTWLLGRAGADRMWGKQNTGSSTGLYHHGNHHKQTVGPFLIVSDLLITTPSSALRKHLRLYRRFFNLLKHLQRYLLWGGIFKRKPHWEYTHRSRCQQQTLFFSRL